VTTKPTHYPRDVVRLVDRGSRFLLRTYCGWSMPEDRCTPFIEEATCKTCLQVLHRSGHHVDNRTSAGVPWDLSAYLEENDAGE
jgi:hypothetical protein